MVILNKTLWLLIMILLSLLPIFASEPPIALKTINNHEDLPNLHLDGSDTYNDGTIILLFTQKSTNKIINNTTIHLRIIFNDETIQSIEIDCSSQPDFIPRCKKSKDSDACSLNPKALIEGYVLIESVDKSERKKQIIVSWDKKIVRYYREYICFKILYNSTNKFILAYLNWMNIRSPFLIIQNKTFP